MTALEHALAYTVERGWAVIPIPQGEKGPRISGWQNLRIAPADLPRYFNGQPLNIGVLNGEPSGHLIDIDLDATEAVALASHFLPPTSTLWGRPSKRRSHWLYRV